MATSENPPDPPFFQGGGGTYKSTILTVFHPLDYAMSLKKEYKNRVSMERPRGRLTGIDPKEQIIEADR